MTEVQQAILRLSTQTDFKTVLEHIRANRDEATATALKSTEPTLIYRAQGRFEALEALIRLTDPPKPAPRRASNSF